MRWIPVTEHLPESSEYPFPEVIVWVEYPTGGCVMIADVRNRFHRWSEDTGDLEYIDGFNFHWGGGDNDRTWPQDNGVEDGIGKVTHWMPLPEAP